MVVIQVFLATQIFYFHLSIMQLMAKAFPVTGARFKKPAQGNPSRLFVLYFFSSGPWNEYHLLMQISAAYLRRFARFYMHASG